MIRVDAWWLAVQPLDMRVGTEAYLAHLVVIEILTVRLAQRLGPVATRGLQQFKQLLHKHGFDSAEYAGALESSASKVLAGPQRDDLHGE